MDKLTEFYNSLLKKQIAAGVLFFDNKGELLIVKPSYKNHWSVPGGVIENIKLSTDKIKMVSGAEQPEIAEYRFLAPEEAIPLFSDWSRDKIARSIEVLKNNQPPIYLENGQGF